MDDFYEEKSGDLSVRRDQIDAFIEEDVNEDHNHRDLQDTLEPNLEELTENILNLNTNKEDDRSTQSSNTILVDN